MKSYLRKIHVGQRVIRTSIAVFICFIIYILRGQTDITLFSAIAAISCMQAYREDSGAEARNYIIGTMVGSFYGCLILVLFVYGKEVNQIFIYFVVCIGLIFVIETTVYMKKPKISSFSSVVFLSIIINDRTDAQLFIFVINRIIDTLVGIFVSIAINSIHIPRKRREDILFISGLDRVLLTEKKSLTPYSKVELNRLIADGVKFTISTEKSPASLMEDMRDVKLNLPVIAMNGAVLYDIHNNKYIKKVKLECETVGAVAALLDERNMGGFYNTIIQDILLICFKDFANETMRQEYQRHRKNAYRNYFCGSLLSYNEVIYIYIIDEKEKIGELAQVLENCEFSNKIRVIQGIEDRYNNQYSEKQKPLLRRLQTRGSSLSYRVKPNAHCARAWFPSDKIYYLKIYSSKSDRQIMSEYLRKNINANSVMTFGSVAGVSDVVIGNSDENTVVKTIKKTYKPYFWEKI